MRQASVKPNSGLIGNCDGHCDGGEHHSFGSNYSVECVGAHWLGARVRGDREQEKKNEIVDTTPAPVKN